MRFSRSFLPAALAVAVLGAGAAHAEEHSCCPKSAAAAPAKSEAVQKTDAQVIAEQKPTYPLDTCVVLGNKLGAMGEAVDYVHEGRLVRFCCKGCIATFQKDPATYLAKLDAAAKKAAPQAEPKAATESNSGHQH